MRLAIINERSVGDRNKDIVAALDGFGHEVFNFGVKKTTGDDNELTYIDTGFLAALLLNTKKVDFVIGGCGTGQGWSIAANKFPGVFCGYVASPLDAWLFRQINNGNCISLVLNQGYGWTSNVNLQFIFEKLFGVEPGSGFPKDKKEAQQGLSQKMINISPQISSFTSVVENLDDDIVKKVLDLPGVWTLLDVERLADKKLKNVLLGRWNGLKR
jgi:ribose 5-phosphate isomerase RpiB